MLNAVRLPPLISIERIDFMDFSSTVCLHCPYYLSENHPPTQETPSGERSETLEQQLKELFASDRKFKGKRRAVRRRRNALNKRRREQIVLLPGYNPYRGYILQTRTADGQRVRVGNHVQYVRNRGLKRFLHRQASKAVRRVPLEDLPHKSTCRKVYSMWDRLF